MSFLQEADLKTWSMSYKALSQNLAEWNLSQMPINKITSAICQTYRIDKWKSWG